MRDLKFTRFAFSLSLSESLSGTDSLSLEPLSSELIQFKLKPNGFVLPVAEVAVVVSLA